MKKIFIIYLVLLFIFSINLSELLAHSGRLDSSGGHYNRKTGSYHYHRSSKSTPTTIPNTNNTSNNNIKQITTLSKAEIIKIQIKLNSLNYKCGIPDGIIGKKTVNAVKSFQKDNFLEVNGILNNETIYKINN